MLQVDAAAARFRDSVLTIAESDMTSQAYWLSATLALGAFLKVSPLHVLLNLCHDVQTCHLADTSLKPFATYLASLSFTYLLIRLCVSVSLLAQCSAFACAQMPQQ